MWSQHLDMHYYRTKYEKTSGGENTENTNQLQLYATYVSLVCKSKVEVDNFICITTRQQGIFLNVLKNPRTKRKTEYV